MADRSLLLVVAVLAVVLAGCGAEREPGAAPDEGRSLRIDDVSIELPPSWDGYTRRIGPDDEVVVIWAATTPFVEPSARPEFPYRTLAALPADGVAVEIVEQPAGTDPSAFPLLAPPIKLADGYFLADAYEGQPGPDVSTQIIHARLADRALYIQVYFGRNRPDDEMRAQADEVLASLTVEAGPTEVRDDGFVRFHDPETGIAGRHPDTWHRARALTNLVVPREVLTLATYPLRDGAEAGECAPDTARADMPPNGAFIWLLEYRPTLGDVWANLPRDRFPLRPDRFRIRRDRLAHVNCFDEPGYSTTFRDADRPFQLLVAFGGKPSDELLAEVEAILDSLDLAPLPPPPPDPYAGWPLLSDNAGDSYRPPPGWAATAATFSSTTPRPRALFFAGNRPLFGLPAKLVPHADTLPPSPSSAVANDFPRDGVLVWVVEERLGGVSKEFAAIDRNWPREDDFRPTEVLTKPNPELRWLRAGGSFRGYRFSVLIGIGPEASREDVRLALKSAAALAVSGCRYDATDLPDCAQG